MMAAGPVPARTIMSDPPSPSPTAAILTLGCKLNLANSETMARQLRAAGWTVIDRPRAADAVIVNTCSVTHVADHKSRHLVRKARRLAPDATVAVTGCLLETARESTIDTLEADLVFRSPKQPALVDRVIALKPFTTPPAPGPGPTLKTRAFVSAQEGCNDVCSFCVVPRTRGRERSKDVDAVVAEVQAREAEGAKEVVITGTQLGAYGRERDGPYRLIGALLARTTLPRIRMSSLQPQDISRELAALWQDRRLCRHFHIALQSGSAAVLQRMRRRYTPGHYRAAVDLLRRSMPDVAITTDVIAGFPGETDAEFDETYRLCREIGFAGMHVFPYSQRSGTLAARMANQVADRVKRDRVRRLIDLGDEMAAAFRRRFIGTDATVLWETDRWSEGARVWEGLTDTYVRVFAASDEDLGNEITPVRLLGPRNSGLWGEVPGR